MAAESSAPLGPPSKVAESASRPRSAAQVVSARTATPDGTSTTLRTPGTASALAASNPVTLPPSAGGRATTPWSIPGTRTSMPNTAAPRVFRGVSRRGTAFPMRVKSFGSLRRGFSGTGSFAAAAARSPYPMRRPEAAWITIPFPVVQEAGSTFHPAAAAETSISRAAAPALRSGSQDWRTEDDPPVLIRPYLGSASACTTRTPFQSASSSSATSTAIPV
jgi:hypothetical protein